MNVPLRLIGVPFAQMDCRKLALEALDIIGIDVPARDAWEAADIQHDREALEAILDATGEDWILRRRASEGPIPHSFELLEGDVLVTSRSPLADPADGTSVHLSVITSGARREALTTSKKMGSAVYRVGLLGGADVFRRAGR